MLPENRIKVTKDRLYSAVFHPGACNPAILAAGDKAGQIGLVLVETSVNRNPTDRPRSFQFRPHSSPVTSLLFPDDPSSSKLYSSSYDGTVRVLDFEKKVFDEVKA